MKEKLAALAAMSNKYGADANFVLAGGGNTSYKSADRLWVKGSGTALATIKPEDFVVLEREKLAKMWSAAYPQEENAREAAVLADMMAARVEGENRRPSVETLLHDLFPQPYILALLCKEKMDAYKAEAGKDCNLLFLQNHGIFFAGNTTEELDEMADGVMTALRNAVTYQPQLEKTAYDAEKVQQLASALAEAYAEKAEVAFTTCPEVLAYDPATKSLSPDHIVYAKAKQLCLEADADVKAAFAAFEKENGYKPKIVFVSGLGMFACGNSESEASTALSVMMDAITVVAYTKSFGGVSSMPDFLIDFIVNWEVESYRSKVSLGK